MNNQYLGYSIITEWSDEDQAYLVTLPEWTDDILMPATHGDTLPEAIKNAQEVLDMLIKTAKRDGQPLPPPAVQNAPMPQRSTRRSKWTHRIRIWAHRLIKARRRLTDNLSIIG
jgi:predicted RNase H-like HicB family nuclease